MASKRVAERISPEAMGELPDGELVRLVQLGDHDAYEVLFRRYYRKIFGMAYTRLRSREDAEDVVQEAFVKVFRYIKSFKGDSSFYTWLYRITANLCIDRHRHMGREQVVELVESRKLRAAVDKGSGVVGDASLDRVHPGVAADRKELMVKLEEAIGELPDYHRDVIIMREVGGLSYSEMAKAMKVSKGTIMSRLFHARRKVKARLDPYLATGDSGSPGRTTAESGEPAPEARGESVP